MQTSTRKVVQLHARRACLGFASQQRRQRSGGYRGGQCSTLPRPPASQAAHSNLSLIMQSRSSLNAVISSGATAAWASCSAATLAGACLLNGWPAPKEATAASIQHDDCARCRFQSFVSARLHSVLSRQRQHHAPLQRACRRPVVDITTSCTTSAPAHATAFGLCWPARSAASRARAPSWGAAWRPP